MAKFCSSCGKPLPQSTVRFCPECGTPTQPDATSSTSETAPEWQVVVGDIGQVPPPRAKGDTSTEPKKRKAVSLHESDKEEANPSGPNLAPMAMTQLLTNGWSGLQSLTSMDPEVQSSGLMILGLSVVAGLSGLVARRSRGLASKVTLISSLVLVLMQGKDVLPQLLQSVDLNSLFSDSGPVMAQLAGLAGSLGAAWVAARKAK